MIDDRTNTLILGVRHALLEGRLKVGPQHLKLADEIMSAPLTLLGLVDTSHLSSEALVFGRAAGGALNVMSRQEPEPTASSSFSATEVQVDLFDLFAQLFAALTGRAVELITADEDIKDRMIWRATHEPDTFIKALEKASTELAAFYNKHATNLFQHAKKLGGMRLVTGGQRTFGQSALSSVRITGLYADTQLIPDPVYPFFAADLHLNAKQLHLAITLFHILQLRPLVNAELPVPPIFVFPSFEEGLEQKDAQTIHGIERLTLQLIGPICNGTVTTLEELFEYAEKYGEQFSKALLAKGLFVPPGMPPDQQFSVQEAIKIYFSELEGFRATKVLANMKLMPPSIVLLTGVIERLRPHYHLLENASELGAQPLLSQPVHWHYFEMCAQLSAEELHRNNILSNQAFQTLRAVQDNSLSWLATIPVETLAELLKNDEHRWLREELNKYTKQLVSSGEISTNDMVREVSYGLASLVQRQQTAMKEIERKYTPKKMAAYFGGGSGIAVAASALFLPSLAPFLVAAAPLAAAVGGGAIGFGKEKIGEIVEKRQMKQSMLGVLATVRPK